jgi:hypothetical protein
MKLTGREGLRGQGIGEVPAVLGFGEGLRRLRRGRPAASVLCQA